MVADMGARPLCEPVEMALNVDATVEHVLAPHHSPASGRWPHFHEVAEQVLFEAVDGGFSAEGRTHRLSAGNVVFVPSMAAHDFDLEPGAKAWRLCYFDLYFLEALDIAGLKIAFCAKPWGEDFQRMLMLADWLAATPSTDTLLVRSLSELLLRTAAQAPTSEGIPMAEASSGMARLRPAIELLRARSEGAPTLGEAATACNLSPPYFSRRFKIAAGMGYADYARLYRLHLAARRLRETAAPVAEIGWRAGYRTPSHFSQSFSRRFGVTPRQYRSEALARRMHISKETT